MTVQGNNTYNWQVFTLKPWSIQYAQQFFHTQCYIPSFPEVQEQQSLIIAPIYYTSTELFLLPFLLQNKLRKKLIIIAPAKILDTPLGNYIAQRGLDSYSVQNDSQKWTSDLTQQDTCFLWFPHNVFTGKHKVLEYQSGLSSIENLIKNIQEEYPALFNHNSPQELKLYLFTTQLFPSIFSKNPLEDICSISYEELAIGTLKDINSKNTILDSNHILEIHFYPSCEITNSSSQLHLLQNLSPNLEQLLFKLVNNLFPLKYSWKNFRNRFLYLLEKTINTSNSPVIESLKDIYEKISTGEVFPEWDLAIDYFENKGLCKKNYNGIQIKTQQPIPEQIKKIYTSLTQKNNHSPDLESQTVRKLKWLPDFLLSYVLARKNYEKDVAIFEEDFTRNFHSDWSKEAEVGKPFFRHVLGSRIGIVLSHGYLSAPMEVRALAEYLYRQGYSVYCVRLKGHGTSPLDLAKSTYEEWYSALNRGIACIRSRCEEVFLCGFSAGGCLVLSASARKQTQIEGVISISAPLKLQNYAINLVPTIATLNVVLKKFGGSGWELFDHHPENPHINYQKNPLAGLQQLRLLMEKTEELLPSVSVPALIIQGSNDTTVNPDSANIIFNSIASEHKKLVFFNRTRHGILNGAGSKEIFETVHQFIKEVVERNNLSIQ